MSSTTEAVALALRTRRQAVGMSAFRLAKRCAELGRPDLDRSTIANIESGRRQRIGVDEVEVLAHALGVSSLDLLPARMHMTTVSALERCGRNGHTAMQNLYAGGHPVPIRMWCDDCGSTYELQPLPEELSDGQS